MFLKINFNFSFVLSSTEWAIDKTETPYKTPHLDCDDNFFSCSLPSYTSHTQPYNDHNTIWYILNIFWMFMLCC